MSKETIKLIKDAIKKSNHNFQDGALISDNPFRVIENEVNPQDVIFGCRIESLTGILIGTDVEIVIVGETTFITAGTVKRIPYNTIKNIKIGKGLLADDVVITAGREILKITVNKKESSYVLECICKYIDEFPENIIDNDFSIDKSLKGIKLDIIAKNFEDGFKLISEKKALYFERKGKGINSVERIIIAGNIEKITQITEKTKTSFTRKAGWGFLGSAGLGITSSLFLGPIGVATMAASGLLAGVTSAKTNKSICFACELRTGERFIASTNLDSYQKLLAISLI